MPHAPSTGTPGPRTLYDNIRFYEAEPHKYYAYIGVTVEVGKQVGTVERRCGIWGWSSAFADEEFHQFTIEELTDLLSFMIQLQNQ